MEPNRGRGKGFLDSVFVSGSFFVVFGLLILLVITPLASASPPSLSDTADLEAFMDGLMADQLMTTHIAGVTVSIVKDGEIIFAKGYGYADDNKTIRPIANETLIRPGSVSKTVTWTALMQLIEEGKVDPDADVNRYLKDIKIPDTYPGQPVTVRNLFTHTAGFEEIHPDKMEELNEAGAGFSADSLKKLMPARVFPPGQYPAYSNFGAALAGLIVQDVSGMEFEDYAREKIFAPLNMTRSTFVEPAPENLQPYVSTAFRYADGMYTPIIEEKTAVISPAGSMYSTSTDMANFMIAHLQNGRFGDNRILEEETAREMHSAQFVADPRLPSMCYGFYEGKFNGMRVIQHAGDLIYFHSRMVLVPDENLGIFVSYNTQTSSSAPVRDTLVQAFMDRYYPVEKPKPAPMAGYKERAGRFAGDYLWSRTIFSDYMKIGNLHAPMPLFQLKATDSGTLLFREKQFVEVEPDYFRQIDGPDSMVFKEDAQGKVTELYYSTNPFFAFLKVEWYDALAFNANLMLLFKAIFGLTVLLWAALAAYACFKKKKKPKDWYARGTMAVLCIVFFAYLVWIDDTLKEAESMIPEGQYLGIVGLVLFIPSLAFCALAWKDLKKWGRLHYALLVLACLAMIIWMWHWNLFIIS
ncbi:serine hydrolase [Candidatus Micrarchaeota archaeon]|nr:serine hydrolase [Candidatus Micrarchaeota archaeon]